MPLKIEIDIAEPRLKFDRLVVSADGTAWDRGATVAARSSVTVDGVFIDPVTQTAMLSPLATLPGWEHNFSSSWARLHKSDFTFSGSADNWVEVERRGAGDGFLVSLGANDLVKTAASYPVNQPFVINTLIQGASSSSASIALECGWGEPGATDTVSLRFWMSGEVTVYRGTTPVSQIDNAGVTPSASAGNRQQSVGQSVAGKNLSFLLIPCRVRELLVVNSDGVGFSFPFSHLPDKVPVGSLENTITPAGKFWFRVPTADQGGTGGQACVQVAPMRFATTGTLYSKVTNLRYAPAAGRVFSPLQARGIVGHDTGNNTLTLSLVKPDGSPFVPNGVDKAVRVKAQFGGDGTGSFGLYAVDMLADRIATTTANAPIDVTPFVRELTLSVPRSGGAASVSMTLRRQFAGSDNTLKSLDTLLPQAAITGDRPFRITNAEQMGETLGPAVDLIRGTLDKPRKTWGGPSANADSYAFTGGDRQRLHNNYSFADGLAFDGLTLTTAWGQVQALPGYDPSVISISADTFVLPYSPGVSQGDWQLVPKRGDTAGQWSKKFHDEYAKTWFAGWRPRLPADGGYQYRAARPDDLPTTASVQLYLSREDAKTALGTDKPWLIGRRVCKSFVLTRTEAEGNQVIVIGYDKQTGQYVTSQWDDAASQNPETAPALRPASWRGQLARVQVISPDISTQAAADRARDMVSARVGVEVVTAEWTSEFLVHSPSGRPLWIGDVVGLHDRGGASLGNFRIVEIPSIRWIIDALREGQRVTVRDAAYVAEKI